MHGERNKRHWKDKMAHLLSSLMEEGEVLYRMGNCLKTQTNREVIEKSELRRRWRLCTYLTMLCSTIWEKDLREETHEDKTRECSKNNQTVGDLVADNAFAISLLPIQLSKKYAKILLALTEAFRSANYVAQVNTKVILCDAALFSFSASREYCSCCQLNLTSLNYYGYWIKTSRWQIFSRFSCSRLNLS